MANHVLKPGCRAPAFTLKSGDGSAVRLTERKGKWVVVYFYPKNFTSGCTQEACEFRDARKELAKLGAEVIGISPDPAESHAEFAGQLRLGFPLLSDRDAKVAAKYGVWREKAQSGRRYQGIVRSTFLIDPAGKIAAVWDNVRVKGHTDKVLARLYEENGR